jgi:hypothetical protein
MVAVSLGSLAGGDTVAVICVGLTTVTFDSATAVPLGVVIVTSVAGQDVVAESRELKPDPVNVIE